MRRKRRDRDEVFGKEASAAEIAKQTTKGSRTRSHGDEVRLQYAP